MRAAPPGLAGRLPPGWAGSALIWPPDENWIAGFVLQMFACKPDVRNIVLRSLTFEDRAWIFHGFDHVPEMVKNLMLSSLWIECKAKGTMGRIVVTTAEMMKRMGVMRCIHCFQMFHAIDRYSGYPLCIPCATDIEFIGLDLRESIQKLRRGEKIA